MWHPYGDLTRNWSALDRDCAANTCHGIEWDDRRWNGCASSSLSCGAAHPLPRTYTFRTEPHCRARAAVRALHSQPAGGRVREFGEFALPARQAVQIEPGRDPPKTGICQISVRDSRRFLSVVVAIGSLETKRKIGKAAIGGHFSGVYAQSIVVLLVGWRRCGIRGFHWPAGSPLSLARNLNKGTDLSTPYCWRIR
jgi:hypothetical protein